MLRPLFSLLLLVSCASGAKFIPKRVDQSWKANYKTWRLRDTVSLEEWAEDIPAPRKSISLAAWEEMAQNEKRDHFQDCITSEAVTLSKRVRQYRSPDLGEVQQAVRRLVSERRAKVSVSIFWGRGRYVRILWPYLERNLAVNGGIVDEILLLTFNRDHSEGEEDARRILESGVSTYPGIVKEVPFCSKPYGCAFDKIMNDPSAVNIKLDDDIVFIKDGSFEHLVYQVLTNRDYTLFSGSVVNNPHGYALHKFVGAETPDTYHYKSTGQANEHPVYNYSTSQKLYWGKNVYDWTGGQAHESFIYNVANGRLDAYTFDLWNMNECRCADPQPAMEYCIQGYYRWSINAIAWLYNVSSQYGQPVPNFDEPAVSMGWTKRIAPHRAAIVGEALFVHCQYTRQRQARPDFGLIEEILLPWYYELMKQYTSVGFGKWTGNATLVDLHERLNFEHGEVLYAK